MSDVAVDADALERLARGFAERQVDVGRRGAQITVRESGPRDGTSGAQVLVCLHGIGSGSASWWPVAGRLAPQARVIAWDAPGYGTSTPLESSTPTAYDYASRLHALLDAMDIGRCVLVGHSLGAFAAAATARALGSERVARLVLISPARGYGGADRTARSAEVRSERLGTLQALGIAGMAAQRTGRLLSDGADAEARAWVRWNMARLNDGGYRQAIELLCGDDLLRHLPPPVPCEVFCGALDLVTPPSACAEIAAACGVALQSIPAAGHASYLEQPGLVAQALLRNALMP